MFSIRMRATKTAGRAEEQKSRSITKKTSELPDFPTCRLKEIHISGAEGIYEKKDIQRICHEYIQRAVTHPRGRPDEIFITIEKLRQKPQIVPMLQVRTFKCSSPREAEKIINETLSDIGVSQKAINNAFKILRSKKTMRGASLMLMKSGKRVEPDKERGVRVSRMGIGKFSGKRLSRMLYKIVILAKAGIQSKEAGFRVKPGMTGTHDKMIKNKITTVKEALILASKVASCPDIIAEVCISDDPDYTTGYVASKKFGYLRITNIKNPHEIHGGRVMFIKKDADIKSVIAYLERLPVLAKSG